MALVRYCYDSHLALQSVLSHVMCATCCCGMTTTGKPPAGLADTEVNAEQQALLLPCAIVLPCYVHLLLRLDNFRQARQLAWLTLR